MKAFRSQLVNSITNTGSSVFSRSILPTSLAEFGRRVMTLMPQHSQRKDLPPHKGVSIFCNIQEGCHLTPSSLGSFTLLNEPH